MLVACALLLACALLVACSTAPPRPAPDSARPAPATRAATAIPPPDLAADGPEASPPPGLMLVPDALPQLEPVRTGGPNKPYAVLGQAYTPLLGDPVLAERGLASWYGRKFHGRPTASGETYNMYAMTAAHKTMPLPSYARVHNPANGRAVVLRINDRGPFHPGRVIDLSYTAALKLGLLGGVGAVEVQRITQAEIRSGAWRSPQPDGLPSVPADDPLGDLLQRTANTAAAPAPLPAETGAPAQAAARAAPGFWLQLGAFAERDGALGFQQRVASQATWLAPLLAVFHERSLHRLQAGPYGNRSEALVAAARLRDLLQLLPAIVERR